MLYSSSAVFDSDDKGNHNCYNNSCFSFQVFDKTMKKKLYDRLLYIFSSQV